MKLIFRLFIILALIGVASAAVYITANPECRLYFDRPNTNSEVAPVLTDMKTPTAWTNSYGMGTMDGNIIEMEMRHQNTIAETVSAVVYIEIECDDGMMAGTQAATDEFILIGYEDPTGVIHPCDSYIETVSTNKIKITPPMDPYDFEAGVWVYSNLSVEFVDLAYGNYIITVYVDEAGV